MIENMIAVTIGDIDGIGIEILINSFKKKQIKKFFLITNEKILKKYLKKNHIKIKIEKIINLANKKIYQSNTFYYYDIDARNNNENAYQAIKESYLVIKKNNLRGIINLPVNKNKINKNVDSKFLGQTEFYQKLDNKKTSNMIFIYKNINITILTTHIKIDDIIRNLSKKNFIYDKIISLNKTLEENFGLKSPKLLISGINPHASDNGTIGKEEKIIMNPTIKKLRGKKIIIEGPKSADSIMNTKNFNNYDSIIFCFHDQALVAYKYISKNRGVNFTGGLSFIRTSVDHGTAYDLVGKNKAENKSLLNCFALINKIKK